MRGSEAHQRAGRGLDRRIAELAAGQHGVVSLAQLRALGMEVATVDGRAAAGRLHRVHEQVFAVGHPLLSVDGFRFAAVLACGPDALLSHRSAAAHWGLRPFGTEVVDVTAPRRRGRWPDGIAAHRDGSIHPRDRTSLRGVPCTTVARTLLDFAGTATASELRAALKEAEVLRILDRAAVREVVGRSRRRRGVGRLRVLLAEREPLDSRTRNRLEERFLRLCSRVSPSPPAVNSRIQLPGGEIEVDFLWSDAQLIVETDGREVHGTAAAFESDRLRDQRLALAGYAVLRFTWRQIGAEPERVINTVRQIHARRASQPG